MAMEACLGFSPKVISTITDMSAKVDSFQSVHSVTVDSPEEMVFFEAAGHGFVLSNALPL